ncbi:MAG: hypothetical protein PHN56_00745 [Candidatus Nanoarchaeia archaeon]|nr:hypothetical protein [Candidatus Nanoarchaeia archaeon]
MKKNNKFIYWAPRVLTIIYIFFLSLFSLDVFQEGYDFFEVILAFLMHNILSFILIIILIISWKQEIVGAIAFILFGLAYSINILANQQFEINFSSILIISGPAFLIGVLFLINWLKNKKKIK